MTALTNFNSFKHYIHKIKSYLTVNSPRLHYKDKDVSLFTETTAIGFESHTKHVKHTASSKHRTARH
jgi:hypothetical protein